MDTSKIFTYGKLVLLVPLYRVQRAPELHVRGPWIARVFVCNLCLFAKITFLFFKVPGEPVIVNVTSKTNSLEVTWEPPTEPNGIITMYLLCWMLSVEHNATCVSLSGGTTGHEIRSLSKWQRAIM